MSKGLIVATLLAFAVGTSVAWIQARRRMRERLLDKLVAEAEQRIKEEVVRRAAIESSEKMAKGQTKHRLN